MRRGPGIGGLQRTAKRKENFRAAGASAEARHLETMRQQLEVFKSHLEQFALQHREQVKRDPVFRARFNRMCASVGVDPLASNKGFWSEMLGIGDFYYELAVQIVECCIQARGVNGGLTELSALHLAVCNRRGNAASPVSEDDLVRAIDKLKVLGSGFDIISVGKKRLVRSVPRELSTDENTLVVEAEKLGYVTASDFMGKAHWSDARFDQAVQSLLREGMAMVDDGAPSGERLFWFPCLRSLH